MGLRPISKNSVVDALIVQLRQAIADGVYPPGAHLNQEELAAAAGISRTPIRQALLAAAREGLVEEGTQGFRVVRVDVEQVLDLFDLRGALEGAIAKIAAKRASPQDIERLQRAAEEGPVFAPAAGGADDFHSITAEIVGWPVVSRIRMMAHSGTTLARSELIKAVERGQGTRKSDEDAARDEHRQIVAAIAARDGKKAERLVRNHFAQGRDRLKKALRD